MIYKNFSYLYQKYDSYLIDVYGVLYNGGDFFEGVLNLLEIMKKAKKTVIILSNTTLVSSICKERYSLKGLIQNIHYDEFISSGEVFKKMISEYFPGAKLYYQIFNKNKYIFERTTVNESYELKNADFIYVGSINDDSKFYTADDLKTKSGMKIKIDDITSMNCHEIEGFEDITKTLDICLKYDKTLVIVNPDIFALEVVVTGKIVTKRPILCQGVIGEFYEKMGGKVLYFGKPYPAVYDFAKKSLLKCNKTAMVGDTLWTDIPGGNMAEFDTVLTLTGVSNEFFKSMDKNFKPEKKIDLLLSDISPKMTHKTLMKFSQKPTYIIESVA